MARKVVDGKEQWVSVGESDWHPLAARRRRLEAVPLEDALDCVAADLMAEGTSVGSCRA
jgi:hypothetical protein